LLSSASVEAQDLKEARVFVTKVYSQYDSCLTLDSDDCGSDLDPNWFSKSLWHLIDLDRKAAEKAGGSPYLDADPICACQDPNGLRVVRVQLSPRPNSPAIAWVTLNSAVGVVRHSVVFTKAGWRIDDIAEDDIPSLRKFLITKQSPGAGAHRSWIVHSGFSASGALAFDTSSLGEGYRARPRKTNTARFTRTISWSESRPILFPSLVRGVVMMRSIAMRESRCRPFAASGCTTSRKSDASVSFVVSWQNVTDGAAANWSSCKITTGRGLLAYPSPPAMVQISPRFKNRRPQASSHSAGS
jgi:hypothetical protein